MALNQAFWVSLTPDKLNTGVGAGDGDGEIGAGAAGAGGGTTKAVPPASKANPCFTNMI